MDKNNEHEISNLLSAIEEAQQVIWACEERIKNIDELKCEKLDDFLSIARIKSHLENLTSALYIITGRLKENK